MLRLAHSQKLALVRDGYVVVPGAIARIQVDATLKAINHWLGKGMDPGRVNEFWKTSFCPELRDQPLITDLMNRGCVHELTESAIGEGKVLPVPAGQIALRFPSYSDAKSDSPGHIDGMYPPSDANPKGVLNNFTAVVGIQLSDMPATGMGNLAVWPGSHRKVAAYLREAGPQSVYQGMPQIDYGSPVQLTAAAGDLIIMHYLLVHGITLNHSPHVRYALYYRPKHVRHDAEARQSMTDLWRHWEGLSDQVAEFEASPVESPRVSDPVPALHTPLVEIPATPEHLKGKEFRPPPKQIGTTASEANASWIKRKLKGLAGS